MQGLRMLPRLSRVGATIGRPKCNESANARNLQKATDYHCHCEPVRTLLRAKSRLRRLRSVQARGPSGVAIRSPKCSDFSGSQIKT